MNNIKIRQASISDAEVICLLGRTTFTETFAHYFNHKKELLDYYEQTFSVDKIRNSLLNLNNTFFIVLRNKLPIGYAKIKLSSPSVFTTATPIAQLQKIYILKDFIGIGIGSLLQSHLLDYVKNKDISFIWLSVFNENKSAIKFYEKNQFYMIGYHNFQIGRQTFEFTALCK